LFSEAHEELCSNSAETVDRAYAGTIKYVSLAYLTMELVWWRGCRSEATTSKDDGPKPEPYTTLAFMRNFRCPSGIARHVREVLEEADDEVVDGVRNVEEGEFTCERGVPYGAECFGKVQ